MLGISLQSFLERTRSIAPEGGVILTKVSAEQTRYYYKGEFEEIATMPRPSSIVGQTALRLEDAYIYENEGLAEDLAVLLNKHGIGGAPWAVAAVSDFIEMPVWPGDGQ